MKQKENFLQNVPRLKISVNDIPRQRSFYSAIPRGNLAMKSTLSLILLFIGFFIFSCTKEPDLGDTGNTGQGGLVGAHPIDNDRTIPYDYSEWMMNISDNKYLSAITIPGTHDCGADLHTSAQGAMEPQTIAQDFRVSNQLKMGVRWFDVRVNLDDGELKINHGPYYLHKHLGNLIEDAIDFLNDHPSEVVIFMIKQEHSGKSDSEFGDHVYNELQNYGLHHFWLHNYVPLVGEVRGKIVIVRRFWNHTGKAFGMHFEWDDNTKGNYFKTSGIHIFVQDHYKLATVSYDTKNNEIIHCIKEAHNSEIWDRFYLNFTSGEANVRDLRDVYCNIAPVINTWLAERNYKRCGVIMLNFAGGTDNGKISSKLLKTVIECNEFSPSQVTIGTQIWKTENLGIFHYKNGERIPEIFDNSSWGSLTNGAFCDYDNNGSYPNEWGFGRLYNWYALNDPRGLVPDGWHIPDSAEYNTLINYLGGNHVAGGKMKKTVGHVSYWFNSNVSANNSSGFSGVGGGWRNTDGTFKQKLEYGYHWTSTENGNDYAYNMHLWYNSTACNLHKTHKSIGCSIRLIKD